MLKFQTEICEGGLVPKSFYMSVEEYEKEKAEGHHLFDDSMYHVISLAKGQFHEVIIFLIRNFVYLDSVP